MRAHTVHVTSAHKELEAHKTFVFTHISYTSFQIQMSPGCTKELTRTHRLKKIRGNIGGGNKHTQMPLDLGNLPSRPHLTRTRKPREWVGKGTCTTVRMDQRMNQSRIDKISVGH